MCDTVIATGSVTADGRTIFGKNSDREPNEAHHIVRIPAADHAPDSQVQCTYVSIPQVEHTYEVLLAKPFWIWGAEMGANEHGVTIGNEALFTRVPYVKGDALIGMDFLRLGLERARTAREALSVITTLLAAHGQGGNCGLDHAFYYHNSYIIADPSDAWVLETAGKQWAAQQVQGVGTISNGITIGAEWDLASDDLITHAMEQGWCKSRDDFHFARCYSDPIYTRFSYCRDRQQCTTDTLNAHHGKITPQTVMAALRLHGADDDDHPGYGLTGATVCMHAGYGPIRGSQTTGSMVSVLGEDVQTHFVTATAAPCTSIFKPLWIGVDVPDTGAVPNSTYDEKTLFWQHERLHRAVMENHAERLALYVADRDALEAEFVAGALACANAATDERAAYAADCFQRADVAERQWLARVQSHSGNSARGPLFARAWRTFDKRAGIRDS